MEMLKTRPVFANMRIVCQINIFQISKVELGSVFAESDVKKNTDIFFEMM